MIVEVSNIVRVKNAKLWVELILIHHFDDFSIQPDVLHPVHLIFVLSIWVSKVDDVGVTTRIGKVGLVGLDEVPFGSKVRASLRNVGVEENHLINVKEVDLIV